MASTYTNSLKIQQIGAGEQSGYWGTTTNTNWTLIEQAVAGVQSIVMTNSDYTMTNLNGVSDEARNMVLVVTGTNSAIRKVIAPLNQPKMYVISNQTTGGYAITIGASTGLYVTIPNGVTAQVYTDGTNFYSAQTGSAGDFIVNGTFTATGISDTGNLSVGGNLAVTGTSTFTGIPSGPTASAGTNTTQLATTAFVTGAITTATGSLGTMSTQNANNVSITGGSITGITDLAVADGGTGASTFTANSVVLGNGTSSLAGNMVAPSTAGNLLVSNGTTWTSTTLASSGVKLGLGITGETWHDVTGSRSQGVTYTNSYAYPIQVQGNFGCNGGGQGYIYINGTLVSHWAAQFNGCGGYSVNMPVIVPPGATYQLANMGGSAQGWYELY